MGKLSEQEAKEYERLARKREAPDPEPISRHVSYSVDLGKKDQVELARKLGLLGDDDSSGEEGSEGGSGDGNGDGKGGDGAGGRKPDKVPRRGGYFD